MFLYLFLNDIYVSVGEGVCTQYGWKPGKSLGAPRAGMQAAVSTGWLWKQCSSLLWQSSTFLAQPIPKYQLPVLRDTLPRAPGSHIYQNSRRISYEATHNQHTPLQTRKETDIKGRSTHPQRQDQISAPKITIFPIPDASIKPQLKPARTICLL